MKDTKPEPRQSKFQTREPAKPLVQPHTTPPNDHPIFNLVGPAMAAQSEPTPRTPPTPPTPRTDATHPISPERDFTKVPNSVSRDVVPAGHFVGKSKQLYDCLYQRTRGSIVPARRLAISKPDLMGASGIGSERTLLKNLAHLKALGLVQITYTDGRHEGNTYEVFTPEEVGLRTPPTPPTSPTPPTPRHARVEVPPVPPVESGVGGVGSTPLESTVSEPPKTFIKDLLNTDDERVPRPLAAAERELTGKNMSVDKWGEVWEVLVTELKIAAGRTTVSSVPAFLAEHLRRRLWKTDKKQLAATKEEPAATGNTPKADPKNCPDCFGTGMYYPEGFDKGVARCGHEKLNLPSDPTQ
jgi:hypothetical protein